MTGGRKVKKFINNLKKEEKAVLDLRKLYESYGYKKIKLNKFEEYELYNDNKDFLKTENILTFMDLNGKLQALRPDVTLSVVKKVSKNNKNGTEKLYYIENIYRLSKETREYEELEQLGIELIGDIDKYSNLEIIDIAQPNLIPRQSSLELRLMLHLLHGQSFPEYRNRCILRHLRAV